MESQPTLSVLVVAYQQEKTIASAVDSALNQTAEGLEIILSDDASDDGTFAIMQEASSGYNGPHIVHCIKQPKNLGLNQHLNRLIETAKADQVMCMAGDDVSYPFRSEKVIEAFSKFDALLVHSLADTMDAVGKPINYQKYRSAGFFKSTDPFQIATSGALYLGASVAFHKDLIRKYGPLPDSLAYEDLVLGFRASLEGRVGYVNEPLLCYRVNHGITKKYRVIDANDQAKQRILAANLKLAVLEQRLMDVETCDRREFDSLRKKLLKAISITRARRDYQTSGPLSGSEGTIARILAAISESSHYIRHRA